MSPTDITITRLVHAVMLIMGRQPEYGVISRELMECASRSGHLVVPETDGVGLRRTAELIVEATKMKDQT